jgi:hypothetical protein
MNYGHNYLRVNCLEADTVYVSTKYPLYTWDARPFDGSVNLMQYILRLEKRIETLERQNRDRSNWEKENEINIKASGRSSEVSAPPLEGLAKPQENEIVEVEGAVAET